MGKAWKGTEVQGFGGRTFSWNTELVLVERCPRTEHGKARRQPVERGGSDNVVNSFAFYSIGTEMRTKTENFDLGKRFKTNLSQMS